MISFEQKKLNDIKVNSHDLFERIYSDYLKTSGFNVDFTSEISDYDTLYEYKLFVEDKKKDLKEPSQIIMTGIHLEEIEDFENKILHEYSLYDRQYDPIKTISKEKELSKGDVFEGHKIEEKSYAVWYSEVSKPVIMNEDEYTKIRNVTNLLANIRSEHKNSMKNGMFSFISERHKQNKKSGPKNE